VEVDAQTDYEPDALVNCGPPLPLDAVAATNPVVVVEVLSPSTQSIDAGDKLADYFRLPSVRHYLLVRTRRREVVHHERLGDRIETRIVNTGTIALDPPGLVVAMDDFYADLPL
jgi:Uma2 family endonuclease